MIRVSDVPQDRRVFPRRIVVVISRGVHWSNGPPVMQRVHAG